MYRFAPQNPAVLFKPFLRQSGMVVGDVDIFFTHGDRGMAHPFFNLPDGGSRLGQASTERMPQAVEEKVGRKYCGACGHLMAYHTSGGCKIFHCRCVIEPGSQFDVRHTDPVSCQMRSGFPTRETPFRIREECVTQCEDFSGSFSLRKAAAGVDRFPLSNGHVRVGDVGLPQRDCLFRSQSQIQHQDRHLFQRPLSRTEVLFLQFPADNKHPRAFTGQGTDTPVSNQLALLGEQQSHSQDPEFVVDRRDRLSLFLSKLFVALDVEFTNIAEMYFHQRLVRLQSPDALFVTVIRSLALSMLLLQVFIKRAVQKVFQWWGQYLRVQTDESVGKSGSVGSQPFRGFFLVRVMGRTLSALTQELEIVRPNFTAFEEGHRKAAESIT